MRDESWGYLVVTREQIEKLTTSIERARRRTWWLNFAIGFAFMLGIEIGRIM